MRLLTLLALFVAPLAARGQDLKPLLDPLVEPVLKGKKHVGLVVGVYQAGTSHVHGYGKVVTPSGDRTPDGRTLFEIGSVTKTFTGLLLAEAVARGEVKLDDPIAMHLPADLVIKPHADRVPTLLDFATHRSGFPVQPPYIAATALLAGHSKNPYSGYDRKALAATLKNLAPDAPGKKSVYSNLGAGLLGHALANAAKADSFNALVQERVAKPLKLRDTTEGPTGEQRARLAVGHDKDGEPTDPWDFASLEACGGLRSTADDLLRYAAANLGDEPTKLTPSLLDAQKPRADEGGQRKTGLFWVTMTLPDRDDRIVWHNGGTGGFRTMLVLLPEAKTAVVVLCAADRGQAIDKLALDIAAAITPKK